jgi:hypothetical protein
VFPEWEKVRVLVRPGATDLRKQINGLAALAQTAMAGDPLSGHLELPCFGSLKRSISSHL